MSSLRGLLAVAAAALLAMPLAGQERAVVLQLHSGGYSHLRNLNAVGTTAHFKTGYSIGAGVGVQFNEYWGLHGDATLARTEGKGAVAFENEMVNRYFLGGHLELRYPMGRLAPFVFGGGGAVIVDQQGAEITEDFDHFTRGAGILGGGVSYRIPGAPVEILAEGRAMTYKWVAPPFSRTQWDVGYSLGFSYRFGFR